MPDATTIDELWKRLRYHWSIFDYNVLLLVVKLVGCSEAQQIINNFLERIDPSALEGDLVLSCKIYNEEELLWPLLSIKINVEKCTLDSEDKVKEVICEKFALKKYALCFKAIKEGCIELLYCISRPLKSYLLQFEVTYSIMAEFSAYSIISIRIDDTELTLPSITTMVSVNLLSYLV